MKMRKWIGYLSFGAILVLTLSFFNPIRAAVQQIAGLAVAQSSTKWNNVKDAAVGDNLTNGILVGGNYIFDGTNWDRMKGDTTSGIWANIKAPLGQTTMASSIPVTVASNQTSIPVTATIPVSGSAFYAIKRVDIGTGASVNLAFGFTSKKVVIETAGANTDEICIDWIGGTAACPAVNTSGDDRVGPGRTITLDDYAGTSISVIAASSTQTISVRAFN